MKVLSKVTLVAIFAILISGCGGSLSLKVFPKVESSQSKVVSIPCKIKYEGEREYLPLGLHNDNTSLTKAHYTYELKYVKDGVQVNVGLLALSGASVYNSQILAQGVLKIDVGLSEPHIFKSSCMVSAPSSMYHKKEDSSDLGKTCLLAIRNNIDSQLVQYKLKEKE